MPIRTLYAVVLVRRPYQATASVDAKHGSVHQARHHSTQSTHIEAPTRQESFGGGHQFLSTLVHHS